VLSVWAQSNSISLNSFLTFDCPGPRRKSKTVDVVDNQKVNDSGFDLE
jgi:hypothetical protein